MYIYSLFNVFQMDKFEINSCKKWIEENNFHIIALQLPDEDLDKVQDLIDTLISSIQYDDIEFYLIGDGCSPCCNDLLNAQYCQAQGLIHFGHSCLAKDDNQSTISIFYVFYQQSLPYEIFFFHQSNSFLILLEKMYRNFSQQLIIRINHILWFFMIHVFVLLLNSIQLNHLILFFRK